MIQHGTPWSLSYCLYWMVCFSCLCYLFLNQDDVIKWKHFPLYWPFVRGIHRSPVNSPHKDQWGRALMFSLIWPWTRGWLNNRYAGDLGRHRAHALCNISKPSVNSNWSYSRETLNSGQNRRFCAPCDLEMLWMTLKNIRAPLPRCLMLCASFHSHRWIRTKVTVRKCSIRVNCNDCRMMYGTPNSISLITNCHREWKLTENVH